MHGGKRMRGSKSRDHHFPLQVHRWRMSKKLRVQRRSTRQPPRGSHPVWTQEGPRIWEEHRQPPIVQVRYTLLSSPPAAGVVFNISPDVLFQEAMPVCWRSYTGPHPFTCCHSADPHLIVCICFVLSNWKKQKKKTTLLFWSNKVYLKKMTMFHLGN